MQLEDLLQWAESSSSSHPLVEKGRLVKELANNTIKLTDGLYSPQVESEQFQTITRQVREVVDQLMEKLFLDHIEVSITKIYMHSSGCDYIIGYMCCVYRYMWCVYRVHVVCI